MVNRTEIENEIFEMIDNGYFSSHELLIDFILSMTTQELSENWEHIKTAHALDEMLNEEEVQ